MRITEIKTKLCRWLGPVEQGLTPFVNPLVRLGTLSGSQEGFRFFSALVVQVNTAEGITGVGIATLSPEVCQSLIDNRLAPMLIGGDPHQTERLFQRMYLGSVAYGRGGCTMAAISALDIALWDIKARSMNVPVFTALGGRTKTKIPAYCSRLYHPEVGPLVAEAKDAVEAGFGAMKMRLCAKVGSTLKTQLADAERRVGAVREAIGPSVDLMIEAYMGFDYAGARQLFEVLSPFKPRWIEEPLLPSQTHLMHKLKQGSQIPLAAGEHSYGRDACHELIRQEAVDIIQIDVNRVGGFTEALRVCHMAELAGVEVIPHGSEAHNLHLIMAAFACPMAEYFPCTQVEVGNELYWYLFDGQHDAKGGCFDLNEEVPGLGIILKPNLAENFAITEHVTR